MYKLALLGREIQNSQSPEIYKHLLNGQSFSYELWDIPIEPTFDELKRKLQYLSGLSITAPYKKIFIDSNIDYENEFESEYKIVNAVKIDGSDIIATNTDVLAVEELLPIYLDNYKQVLILGDGSMASVLKYICDKKNILYDQLSRSTDGDLSNLNYSSYKKTLLVNCCLKSFCFNSELNGTNAMWDLNYNHSLHREFFKKRSIPYFDGLELLQNQARHALLFWGISY